jgi:glycosyltransferase involved in cell wall biosynthesis
MIVTTKPFKTAQAKSGKGKKVLWVSSINLGTSLHRKSKTEIMGSLAKRGYASNLVAISSTNLIQTENSQVRLISIRLKSVPIISSIMYAVALFFFLPLHSFFSKPDYIIVDPYISVFSLAPVLPISKLTGTKLILNIRSVPVEVSGFRGFLKTLLFTTSVSLSKRLFNGITIITPLMKEEICKRFVIDPERVCVWSSGVSLTLFNPETCSLKGNKLRKKLGLTGKFVVLYHGVFSANRGLIETMEAISIVKKANCKVIFLLLGTGSFTQVLEELIQVKKLQDNVIIQGPVEHAAVPKFIAMCDLGIVPLPDHPYWRTQCPLKLLEYLAMNKVVVITSIPAHQAVVGKKRCGIYISSANPVEIAKSVIYAYHNREKLKLWGTSGRKIIEERYSWEKIAADLESCLLSFDEVS